MSFKAVPLLLAIGAVFVAAVPTPVETERESSLVELLLSSPAMRSDLFNVECVDYYSPLLKGHGHGLHRVQGQLRRGLLPDRLKLPQFPRRAVRIREGHLPFPPDLQWQDLELRCLRVLGLWGE